MPARALCATEREHVLDVLSSPRFVDRSPGEVMATLLDDGVYLCSQRTMYRVLAANQAVRERRNQRAHPQYAKPELMATGPNQTRIVSEKLEPPTSQTSPWMTSTPPKPSFRARSVLRSTSMPAGASA